jgi:hypothetical protein
MRGVLNQLAHEHIGMSAGVLLVSRVHVLT